MGFTDKDLLVRYLLGDLSQSDHERLEEFLAGNEAEEALLAAENDLMDSYVRGELPPERQQQFEEKMLASGAQREHLAVAKMLMDTTVREKIATAPVQSHAPSWWESLAFLVSNRGIALKLALASTALAVAATALLAIQNWRLRSELTNIQSERARMERQIGALQQQIDQTAAAPNGGNPGSNAAVETARLELPQILLLPGLSRLPGARSNQFRVTPRSPSVMLMLDLEQDRYATYEVVIEAVDGTALWRVEGLKSQAGGNGRRIVAVTVPSQLLIKGDYVIALATRGADGNQQTVDSYTLSVVR